MLAVRVLLSTGSGLTVIEKFVEVPLQLVLLTVYTGVTTKLPEMGEVPALVPVKEEILPVPFDPIPMAVLLFVQV